MLPRDPHPRTTPIPPRTLSLHQPLRLLHPPIHRSVSRPRAFSRVSYASSDVKLNASMMLYSSFIKAGSRPEGFMQLKHVLRAVVFLLALIFAGAFVPSLRAQDAPLPTPDQLDQLLAPVALYPDTLLAQITTASTDPQEILDVDNWLAANPDLSGTALTDAAQAQGFDPALIALVNFPQIIH